MTLPTFNLSKAINLYADPVYKSSFIIEFNFETENEVSEYMANNYIKYDLTTFHI